MLEEGLLGFVGFGGFAGEVGLVVSLVEAVFEVEITGLLVVETGFLVSEVLVTMGLLVPVVELGFLVTGLDTGGFRVTLIVVGLLVVEFLGGNLVAGILGVVELL